MDMIDARKIYDEMMQSSDGVDGLRSLQRDLLELAIRYARLRADWRMEDLEGRIAMDARRRLAHNAFIDSCDILSRACVKFERPDEWRRKLGSDRKEIGDFACLVHAILGVLAR
ncbi:MAG: DUF3232 domain-containing protein [Candidatus Eisenbacteria bacterium]|uniref:DUF3232 domain-containing protein n=1 Tax=Eiseniibacteriota bacterium TaxID=2212470 RepID=A0A933W2Y0_UNCEI|nr:DUF3232 domain-containing protein [Candidatus Eisenbacteria bacterium]